MGNEEALKDNEEELRVTGCVGGWHERVLNGVRR